MAWQRWEIFWGKDHQGPMVKLLAFSTLLIEYRIKKNANINEIIWIIWSLFVYNVLWGNIFRERKFLSCMSIFFYDIKYLSLFLGITQI